MGNRPTQGAENPRRPLSTGRPSAIQRGPSLLTCGRYVGRIGSLAVALGVGAAVVAMPLAAADSSEGDSASVSAGQPDTGGRTARTATQPRTAQRGAAARAAHSAASAPRAAATETGSPREVAAETSPAAATERARAGAGRGTAQRRPTTITADATALSQASRPAAVIDPAAAPLDGSSVTPLSTDRAEGAVWSCRECRNPTGTSAARPVAAPTEQTLTGPGFAVQQLLDAVGTWLSGLPSGPVTDLLAGALLMVRRELFNQTPTVAPRVLVDEVLRPMAPAEGSTFSTSLTGEVVGTLGATDPEGAVLSYAVSQAPQFGTVRIDPNGSWTYNPTDASAALEDVFTVSVSDGGWNILDPFAAPTTVIVAVRPGLSSSAIKPGLIASDWLEVVKETGEINGDEPVMLTVVMTTTLGVAGSTSVRVVNRFPGQIASGVDTGDKVRIPDSDGDVWIDYSDKFKPLTWDAWMNTTEYGAEDTRDLSVFRVNVTQGGYGYDPLNPPTVRFEGGLKDGGVAATARVILERHPNPDPDDDFGYIVKGIEIINPGSGYIAAPTVVIEGVGVDAAANAKIAAPVPLPVIVVATLMLEGDFSPPGVTGDLGTPVSAKLKTVGEELEKTKIYVPNIVNGDVSALTDAATIIKSKVELTGADYAKIASMRIGDWFFSLKDPDDPVAVGIAGLIPLDGSFIDSFTDLRTLSFGEGVQLDDQFMYSKTVNLDPIKILGVQLWDFDLATRFGFLVPPSKNDKKDGNPQGWETTYAGDYADNDWAEWKVETKAWPQINW